MPFDKLKYPKDLWEERRKSVQESLRIISVDQLKELARKHQDEFIDYPWRDEFLRLVTEQPHATFYHAVAQEDAEVLYCRDADFGIWVVPGSGMGPLDETGKRLMKDEIDAGVSGGRMGGRK
jgi:hypothetical protein